MSIDHNAAVPRVVSAGETMLLAAPTAPGRLRHAAGLGLSIGGAESNVAIGLARLGVRASWVSALGDDEPGEVVLHRLRAEGVYYYRRGSAASTLAPGDLPLSVLAGADFLHLSGITAALSPECAEFVPWAAKVARQAGVRVSYDVNYRSRLWEPSAARAATEALLPHVDVLLVGDEEAAALWGWDEDTALSHLADSGPREVVLKLGSRGCVAVIHGDRLASPGFPARQVDPIGAGDAFAAGYLAATLWGWDPQERLRAANAMGALCVQNLGDYEGLPSRRELLAFLDRTVDLGR
jgi:2-dehydro-3-deoxygluconokinase